MKLADELEVQVLERRARPTGQPSSGAAVPYARTFGATYGYCGIQRKLQCLLSAYGAVGPLRAPGEEGTTRAWRSGGNKGSRSVAVQSARTERRFKGKRHKD